MHPYPTMYSALGGCVGEYVGDDGTTFLLRRAGRGFFAEFRWPGPRVTLDVILLGLGVRFLIHHDTEVYELGFRPAESEVGEELSLRFAGQLCVPPGPESFAELRFAGSELVYTLGLFGDRNVKRWVLARRPASQEAEQTAAHGPP